jgi:hypothetical protein
MAPISERESREIAAANASGTTPVVFIHGLWLLRSSWASCLCRRSDDTLEGDAKGAPPPNATSYSGWSGGTYPHRSVRGVRGRRAHGSLG